MYLIKFCIIYMNLLNKLVVIINKVLLQLCSIDIIILLKCFLDVN